MPRRTWPALGEAKTFPQTAPKVLEGIERQENKKTYQ
jgi:hypothetical protein